MLSPMPDPPRASDDPRPERWPTWSVTEVLTGRPAVRVNQRGYLPDAPKRATWVTDVADPVDFTVFDPAGVAAFRGTTEPWERVDPSSGRSVQLIDFSGFEVPGPRYVIQVADERSHPFAIDAALYDELARDALEVFYLLRSGCPISDRRAPGYGRPAGHPGDAAVPGWSGPDAERLYPGWVSPGPFDVSGGWYDAGDYGKYATSGAIALWQLLDTVVLLDSGGRPAPVEVAMLIEECRWQLDWLLRMQVPSGHPLAGLVFHRVHGTTWSPLPGWPHEDPTARVLHRPSTAASLQLAAVAARAARVLGRRDPGYADRLLVAGRTAYAAARRHPDLIAPDDEGRFGGGPYGDPDPSDDFYWAAVELWLATGDPSFADAYERSPWHHRSATEVFDPGGFDYDRVAGPARLDLAAAGDGNRPADQDRIVAELIEAGRELARLAAASPWGQPYGPGEGWAWGSNGRILNNLVVIAAAARLSGDRELRDATTSGMDYLLGRNALGQSYVVGYGTDPSRHPRTRQFGHDLDPAFPPAPPGALTGGANSTVTPGFPGDPRLAGLPAQLCYLDEPTSETTNDICIRWNAPLVHVATQLALGWDRDGHPRGPEGDPDGEDDVTRTGAGRAGLDPPSTGAGIVLKELR